MADWKGYKKFYIHIKGQGILHNKIAIRELSLTLSRFQTLYDNISIISVPRLEKKDMWLYFSTVIEDKSVVVEIQHEEHKPTLMKEYEKPDSFFETLFNVVLDPDYNKGLNEFRKLVHSPISRVELLSNMRDLWSTKKRKISIGFGENLSDANLKKLPYTYKNRIGTWLLKEIEELSKEFRCFITRVKYDFPSSFSVIDDDGNIIKGKLTSNIKVDVKKYSGELVRIKGVLNKKGKVYRFLKIDYIKPISHIEIKNNVYGLPIFHNLRFNVKLFEDGIVLTEEFLNIRLYVRKLAEVETELRDYLEILKEEYIDVSINSLDHKAIEFRDHLIKLFGE